MNQPNGMDANTLMPLTGFRFFPREASTIAPQVDALFAFWVALSVIVMLIVGVPLIYFVIKYRKGSNADRSNPVMQNLKLELTWIIVPSLIFIGAYMVGAKTYMNINRVPGGALQIYVVAKQWMWKFQHPSGQREIDELHVPINRNVKLTMISQDVIHDLFIPDFRIKQDVLPARYTTLWFKATELGTFRIFCSQFCGTYHARMTGTVIVQTPSAYAHWLERGNDRTSLAQQGSQYFTQFGCAGCHGRNSTVHAPDLAGVYGKPVHLKDGRVLLGDDRYLRDCMVVPATQRVAGYPPVMPSFKGQLSEEQIMALVEYIKGLDAQNAVERKSL
jgi:cytochrome c oxidase subunit 2